MTDRTRTLIVVGAGFYGATIAERFASHGGWRVIVLEKRPHVAGNSYSRPDPESGVEEHVYGSHIFHPVFPDVWDYVNRFTTFNNYRHVVWARREGRIYPLPFGLAAINLLLGRVLSPAQAREWVEAEARSSGISAPKNLEEKALSMIGRPLYEAFVKAYTEKQWGRPADTLPAYIITRLPVRYTYDTSYFSDPWQGIPVDGFGTWAEKMLRHPAIEVRLSADYFDAAPSLPPHDLLVYTGCIDEFFHYQFGDLGWRSVRFEKQVLPIPDYQGTSVINECDPDVSITRTHEFAHYTPDRHFEKTVIYRETSFLPTRADDKYYPIRAPADLETLEKYQALAAATVPHVHFGGRLGAYRYLDMDKTIHAALEDSAKLLARFDG
jgi:UDP-galactopyranose mutase